MKNRTLLIVIGVILLCCCVVGVAAALSYSTIQKYLNSAASGLQNLNPAATSSPDTGVATQAPGISALSSSGPVDGGLGDPTLKTDVWNSILTAESGKNCADVTSTAIDITQKPNSKGVWMEDWTINACGSTVVLHVTFTPDPQGGTNYAIKQ
jgi:hypothetical protein